MSVSPLTLLPTSAESITVVEGTPSSCQSEEDADGDLMALHFGLSAIGPGFLTLPYGLAQAGLLLFSGLIVLAAFVSARAVLVILQAKLDTKDKFQFRCPTTFPDLIRRVLGKKWAWFTEAIIIVNGFGVAISFLIFLGDFATPAVQSFISPNSPRSAVIMIVAIGCICLSSVPDLGRLKWLSVLPLTGLLWTSATLIYMLYRDSSLSLITEGVQMLVSMRPSWSLMVSFNVCLFAMMMHVNVIPLLKESPTITRSTLTSSLYKSHATLAIFYFFVAIAGCLCSLTYTPHVSQNFTVDLPTTVFAVLMLRLMLSLTLLGIAPYQFMAIATSMIELKRRVQKRSSAFEESLLQHDEERDAPIAVSTRFAATAILIGTATVAALLTSEVATLLSMVGGFGTTTLMCTLPAMLRWRYSGLRPSPSSEELKNRKWTSHWDDKIATILLFGVALAGYVASLIIIVQKVLGRKV